MSESSGAGGVDPPTVNQFAAEFQLVPVPVELHVSVPALHAARPQRMSNVANTAAAFNCVHFMGVPFKKRFRNGVMSVISMLVNAMNKELTQGGSKQH